MRIINFLVPVLIFLTTVLALSLVLLILGDLIESLALILSPS